MDSADLKRRRTWGRKFSDAGRGVWLGSKGEASFRVHALCTVAVLVAAALLPGVSSTDWCLLILCIAGVCTAELFNSAVERLAAALHPDEHPAVGTALDIASGAVLVCSLGAATVGMIVLGPSLVEYLS